MGYPNPETKKTTSPASSALKNLVRLLARSAARELLEQQKAPDLSVQTPDLAE